MEGKITWGKLEANFTMDKLEIVAVGAASALITMATLLFTAL